MIRNKLLWRCHVCNDLHYGERPPLLCPTCAAKNAFVRIDRSEALRVIGDRGGEIAVTKDVVGAWEGFSKIGSEYKLVDDREMVTGLADGVVQNQLNHGLKYCPCRLTTGDLERDLKLICPCSFEVQQTYRENGECWCGLFERRKGR